MSKKKSKLASRPVIKRYKKAVLPEEIVWKVVKSFLESKNKNRT